MAWSRGKPCQLTANLLLILLLNVGVETSDLYTLDGNTPNSNYKFHLLDHAHRLRRDVPSTTASSVPAITVPQVPTMLPATVPPAAVSPAAITPAAISPAAISPSAISPAAISPAIISPGAKPAVPPPNQPNVKLSEVSKPSDSAAQAPMPASTLKPQIPNVGVNGSGIRLDPVNLPKVSTPIDTNAGYNNTSPDENMFKETPEMIQAEQNLTGLTYLNHTFYNSTFIGDAEFFKEHWLNISKMNFVAHPILSSSHRRATTVTLSFEFPFYGQPLKNITVATGGFIYTGDHVHNWLAATQYIAPLMANFDTRPTNDSVVKIADDGTKVTVIWENVTLQENLEKAFTFAVTLQKDGDIIFAYKDVPIPIQSIEDKEHPVKVGISDAYLQDRVVFFVRRKTIYEYHRVNFLAHNVTSGSILRLHALPTCLLYTTCESCINHKTNFNCSWCNTTERCSSGLDRMKQDWLLRSCDKNPITSIAQCSSNSSAVKTGESTSYVTGNKNNPYHDVIMRHDYAPATPVKTVSADSASKADPMSGPSPAAHSSLGGVLVAFVAIMSVAFLGAWMFYAYKNPHTRSGQFLIKYRPSTWNWKRGEARYTAATIHM